MSRALIKIFFCTIPFFCPILKRVLTWHNSQQSRCWGFLPWRVWQQAAWPRNQRGETEDQDKIELPEKIITGNWVWLLIFSHVLSVYGAVLRTAAHARGATAVSGFAFGYCRKPRWAQLPLSDSQLSRMVRLRGRSQRIPVSNLQWNQLHPLQGSFGLAFKR